MDPDNEAPKDPRAELHNSNFTERDFEGHRALSVYVGFHVPGSKHRSHHRRKSRSKSVDYGIDLYQQGTPPSERVNFILEEDDDEIHKPHPLFCEMEQLHREGEEIEWKETARWVKFEEDVEEGGNRWSKPHLATISLHYLLVLRSCFANETVMLDMDADNLNDITDFVLSDMISNEKISKEHQSSIKEILLCRHRHLHEFRHVSSGLHLIKSIADIGKTPTPPSVFTNTDATNIQHDNMLHHESLMVPDDEKSPESHYNYLTGSSSERHVKFSMPQTPEEFHLNDGFMRKIPPDSHALNILIGHLPFLEKPVSAFVRLKQPCFLGDLTEVPLPTKFLFFGMTPSSNGNYHEVGRSLAALMTYEIFHMVAYKAKTRQDFLAGIDEFIDSSLALPAGVWDPSIRIEPPVLYDSQELLIIPDPKERPIKPVCDVWKECGLRRTGRLFGGLIDDVHRKAPWYFGDFKDFISLQCIASVFFLYVACLAPVITFGGLLADATKQRMAVMENLISSVICGILYGLFSGQPLTLLGTTGALLVFEGTIFSYCEWWNIEYLSFRLWIGLWVAAILFIFVAFDACVLICYITRFTEEIFATLISFIFIFQAFENMNKIRTKYPMQSGPIPENVIVCRCHYRMHISDTVHINITRWSREECEIDGENFIPSNCDYWLPYFVPNVFLMSVILFASTFALTLILRKIKLSSFFPKPVRAMMSDFAVIISIVSMTLLDHYSGIDTPKLVMPQEFKPTYSRRGWLIPFYGKNAWWTALLAILPALIATILIFMDQEVTAIIINRKENKLRKGCGYHLDLFVLAILIAICSIFGLPLCVAATMLSMTHVTSLRITSQCAAPGEKPQYLGVREQRGTHICIFILIGLSIFFTPFLKHIPMPVLYGIFLYMGVQSLKGLQFINRVLILFMPAKYQPDYIFLRHVPIRTVHLFTAFQILSLIALFVIKYFSETALCFPAVLIAVILIRRRVFVHIFEDIHLMMLDDDMPEFARRNSVIDSFKDSFEPTYSILSTTDSSKSDILRPISSSELNKRAINITELLMQSSIWKCIDQQMQKSPLLSDKPTTTKKRKKSSKKHMETVVEESDRLSSHTNPESNAAQV